MLYLASMYCHPGKKLLFMGCEFAQGREWNHNQSLDWHQLEIPEHRGVQALVAGASLLIARILRAPAKTAAGADAR